jgi:hypothetical protein
MGASIANETSPNAARRRLSSRRNANRDRLHFLLCSRIGMTAEDHRALSIWKKIARCFDTTTLFLCISGQAHISSFPVHHFLNRDATRIYMYICILDFVRMRFLPRNRGNNWSVSAVRFCTYPPSQPDNPGEWRNLTE